jgi:gliding motility-associated-like protein/uncharacterized repeat protein (TIGR01451 family)
MKHLLKIIAITGLLIIAAKGYSQTAGQIPTFTINQGSSIILSVNINNAAAYQWYKNSVPISGAITGNYAVSTAGTYTVVAFNAGGCPSVISDGVNILVNGSSGGLVTTPRVPQFHFPHLGGKPGMPVDLTVGIQAPNSKPAIGSNFSYVFTANNNSNSDGNNVRVTYVLPPTLTFVPLPTDTAVSYDTVTRKVTWKISRLKANEHMNLAVTLKVLQSGSISSEVNIKGDEPDPIMDNNVATNVQQVDHLVVPNVFTPNGDGVNDAFYIPGLDTYSETQLNIINRWGSTVYEKKNYQNDWTGDGLAEGTYFYVLKVKTLAGIWDVYKGYVTLLRSRM